MSVVAHAKDRRGGGERGLGPVSNKKVENTGVEEEEEMGLLNSFEAAQTQFRLAAKLHFPGRERRGWDGIEERIERRERWPRT